MIDFNCLSENSEVVLLLKQREELDKKINELDEFALLLYEIAKLNEE